MPRWSDLQGAIISAFVAADSSARERMGAALVCVRLAEEAIANGVAFEGHEFLRRSASNALSSLGHDELTECLREIVAATSEAPAVRLCRALAAYAGAIHSVEPHSIVALELYELALRGCPEDVVPDERVAWTSSAAKLATRASSRDKAVWLIDQLKRLATTAQGALPMAVATSLESELVLSVGNLPEARRLARQALVLARDAGSRETEAAEVRSITCDVLLHHT